MINQNNTSGNFHGHAELQMGFTAMHALMSLQTVHVQRVCSACARLLLDKSLYGKQVPTQKE